MMRYFLVLLAGASLFALMQWNGSPAQSKTIFHTDEELALFHRVSRALPQEANDYFIGSGACVECHGSDPAGIASVVGEGVDVNVVDDWRATMMANSAKDPFWRAKVSHEVIVNPHLQVEIETTCTACHAPMGHFEAMYHGDSHYSIAQMLNDSLALDGVSCVACHQMSDEGLGDFFSGQLFYDTNRVAYGPYISPLSSPMIESTGYTPVYSEHINDAGMCAGCHTLLTETVDMSGELTGGFFVEQATYHEWLNSIYNDDISCQSCHMPRIDGPVLLAAGYNTEPRSPFALHYFVGGNTYMIELMRDHRADLKIDATAAQFDSVLARTTRLLQQQTLEMELSLTNRTADTAFFQVNIQNLAGHKFPSGYPSRLAFVEFVLATEQGDTLFASGLLDSDQRIINRDATFEPHYDLIREETQVQIYEMVMADVEGNVTTILERAQTQAKDNRIPPIGFTTSHITYDTAQIVGAAFNDPNFNRNPKAEGTGRDELRYHVPLYGYGGAFTVTAKVYYQSLPPRWMDEMFAESSPEIDYFRDLYEGKSPLPVLIVSDSLTDGPTGIIESDYFESLELYALNSRIYFDAGQRNIEMLQVYNLSGQMLQQWRPNQASGWVNHNLHTGVYLIEVVSGQQRTALKIFVP